MDLIKKAWPYAFKVERNVSSLVVNLIMWVVASVCAGLVLWLASALTSWIPVLGALIGIIVSLLGSLLELYCVIGLVLTVLVFLDILK